MLLSVEHLTVTLRETGQPLVNNLSFAIDENESLMILGQSGCGKTLTCKTLMGILDEQRFTARGVVRFEEQNLLALTPRQKQQIYGSAIAMIPQNPMTALDPSMRVGQQMQETLRLHRPAPGKTLSRTVLHALENAGLSQAETVMSSYPHTLSGGMLQRVLIAMALMLGARLIVADEPTTALDAEHRKALLETLCALRAQGTSLLLITHDFAVASRVGGPLMIMKDGQTVEQGPSDQVLQMPRQAYTRALIEASGLSLRKGGSRVC